MTYTGAWAKIERVDNGWIVHGPGTSVETNTQPEVLTVYQDPHDGEIPGDEVVSLEKALWMVVQFLSMEGSKHDPERIWITTHKHGETSPTTTPD